jgi:hypothetical protein
LAADGGGDGAASAADVTGGKHERAALLETTEAINTPNVSTHRPTRTRRGVAATRVRLRFA